MKKIILLLLFINFYTTSYNQVIKGTVLDKRTNEFICFASVYFNGTFVGTTTDPDGNFEMNITKYSSMPLIISAIGYYSFTLTNYSTKEPLKIYLTPKVYELKGAVVSTKSLERKRKRNLAIFKDEFLGTTANAQDCEIVNEKDITFNYDSDEDTLKAFTIRPVQINNKALGYKITYYLDKFEYYKKTSATFFAGNIIFEEDTSIMKEKQNQVLEKRKSTYLGSRTHFIKALWDNNLESNGFAVTTQTYKYLTYSDIVKQVDNSKYLKFTENLYIDYGKSVSYILFLKNYVYFNETGYFDPSGINWKGEMANQRIADWLPYEYTIE